MSFANHVSIGQQRRNLSKFCWKSSAVRRGYVARSGQCRSLRGKRSLFSLHVRRKLGHGDDLRRFVDGGLRFDESILQFRTKLCPLLVSNEQQRDGGVCKGLDCERRRGRFKCYRKPRTMVPSGVKLTAPGSLQLEAY